jgi:hypothetical protein
VPIAEMRLRHGVRFGSDMGTKSVSLPLPCVDHTFLIVLLCRHFAVSSFFVRLWLVTQLWLVAETACRGSGLRPCSGILPRDSPISSTRLSTDLRVLSAGTRDFLLIGSAARDRPFSLHTSLLRRNLSLLVRTLEPLCSVQE